MDEEFNSVKNHSKTDSLLSFAILAVLVSGRYGRKDLDAIIKAQLGPNARQCQWKKRWK